LSSPTPIDSDFNSSYFKNSYNFIAILKWMARILKTFGPNDVIELQNMKHC